METVAADEGAPSRSAHQRRPSAGAEPAQLAVLLERNERRPHRHPARVVSRAVDGVDDPAPGARPARALLLTENRVVRAARGRGAACSSASTARSASVTGVRSGFVSTATPVRKRGSEIASAASASARASSRSGLMPATLSSAQPEILNVGRATLTATGRDQVIAECRAAPG